MKKILSVLLVLLIIFSVAACGSKTTPEEETKDLLTTIKERGYIIVGTEGTYAPKTFHDENDKLIGYDVEIAACIAKHLGVEVQYYEAGFSSLFAALDAKQIDIIVNEVSYSDERAEKYDFTVAYCAESAGILVRADYDEIKSFDDVKGKVAANEATSSWGRFAESLGATLDPVEKMGDSIQEVLNGRADCTLNAETALGYYLQTNPEANAKLACSSEGKDLSQIPVLKGNETLVEAINAALTEAKASGELTEISNKYFGFDITVLD